MASIVGQCFTTGRTSFVFDRYPAFSFSCRTAGSDVRRNQRFAFLLHPISFVLQPVYRPMLPNLSRNSSAGFESDRCQRQQ